ncbi:MAG TPA: thioredoxin [Candidatus Marinimicrobia bacterium]|nr:thioredoxin [Candidatus Neomarinimicrobiota bacterium]
MKKKTRIMITSAVIILAILIVGMKSRSPKIQEHDTPVTVTASPKIPTLLDLGSKTCIPCKMMAPILEELRSEYDSRMQVIYYDVRENPNQARIYGIRVIPTVIFINEHEEELYRHEGFISKENILDVWKKLGYDFEDPSS